MKRNCTQSKSTFVDSSTKPQFQIKHFIFLFLLFFLTSISYAQKKGNKNHKKDKKDIVIRVCTQYIGNGLYKANFEYDNPTNKAVVCKEGDSYVKIKKADNNKYKGQNNRPNKKNHSNASKKLKGLRKFKPGNMKNAFSIVFKAKEVVEWTVIHPNGKIHVIIASANSSHCTDEEEGFIFPVHGQETGKENIDSKIGLDLKALEEDNAGDEPSNLIYQINEAQKVLIEIVPTEGNMQALINLLTTKYDLHFNNNPLLSDFLVNPSTIISQNLTTVDIYFPIDQLMELNEDVSIVNFARTLHPTRRNIGIVTSQGDAAQKSDKIRESFKMVKDGKLVPVDGTGVKLGVISDSYDTEPFTGISKATVDVQNGDLPGIGNPNGFEVPVQVLQDYPATASDEGRAMLQIVHDVAPGAELAFHTGSQSPRVFELGLQALEQAGCKIIVDDLTFITEPFYGEGRISKAINEFTSKPGNIYFSSAGNFSNHGYQSQFQPGSDDLAANFLDPSIVQTPHVFGTNPDGSEDQLQKIHLLEGTYMIVMQWDEGSASQENSSGATTDLDIYLVDDAGNLVVGNNRFNEAGDPTEVIVFEAKGEGDTNIFINSVGSTPPTGLSFRYIVYQSNGLELVEYNQGAPTISGHAMTPAANIIGAVDYRNANNPEIESFSSYGGILTNQTELEIDFTAPDGGNINMPSFGADSPADEDNFTNFYGTSAAAPHAAGAVVLLMSALPNWYPSGLPNEVPNKTNLQADKVLQIFKQTAVPFGNAATAGAGFIDTENAFKSIAAQSPKIITLIIEDGKTPSAEPFNLTIVGEHFTEESVVLFDGEEVEIISRTDTEIVAKIETFTGNPDLEVNALPKSESGLDGKGDPVKILEDGKIAFNIKANDLSIEFGQDIQYEATVEGLPEGETLASLGLPEVKFTSPAFLPFPDVNNYNITPYFDEELTEEQLALYQINFKNGILTVSQKDLEIQPKNTTYEYGEPIEIELDYNYDQTNISNNEAFLSAIMSAHQSDYYPENTLVFANKFKAVVNEYNILELLNNGSWIASERTIQNKFRAVVNGMQLIDLDEEHFTDYIDASQDVTTNKFRAVVNKFRAVVNSADLFSNNVELSLENKFKAVVNTSGLGDEDDQKDYSKVFAIVDAEDVSTDTEERTIDKLYALNLITGIDATSTLEEQHHIFPGGALAPIFENFNTTYVSGKLQISKANLHTKTNDLVINQGEAIDITSMSCTFTGFKYTDNSALVFPDGVDYYFENAEGEEYKNGDIGVFDIKIRAPKNYHIVYDDMGKLFVNPCDASIRKVRVYLDCVNYDANAADGLNYTANFRYKNQNPYTIYVLEGIDNNLSSSGSYSGNVPTAFLPGEGVFQVRFDGTKLIWKLSTFNITHKYTLTAEASIKSRMCDSELDNVFTVYPNPVQNTLYMEQNILKSAEVEIFNLYGITYANLIFNNSVLQTQEINMQNFPEGMYFVRITTENETKVFNIIKE